MKGTISMNNIIMSVIGIVLSVAMIPVVNQFITDANLTGVQSTVLSLVPLVFIFGIVAITVKAFMGK